ncbi:MAG: hypothetical protein IKI11_10935 [Neisseriaceae bacterium]|nr:hypothetical protein [Neisseriaceae bacterium]
MTVSFFGVAVYRSGSLKQSSTNKATQKSNIIPIYQAKYQQNGTNLFSRRCGAG